MPITYQGKSAPAEFIMEQLRDLRGIKSSEIAKKTYDNLLEKGVLPKLENHEWARLCIAYHFAVETNMETFTQTAPDSNGREIPSLSTCFQDEWRFWLALIIDNFPHSHNPQNMIEINQITKRINDHWHFGAIQLNDRYEKLCVAFPNRYDSRQHWLNELAGLSEKNGVRKSNAPIKTGGSDATGSTETNNEVLKHSLEKIGIKVTVEQPISGVRYDRYTLQMKSSTDVTKLEKSVENLTSELGVSIENIRLARCDDGRPNTIFLDYLRPESTWKKLTKEEFEKTLQEIPKNMLLPVCVGTDEFGQTVFEELSQSPHVFVGGATGAGKSVCIHGMIESLLFRKSESELQIALFDPKRVELSAYRNHKNLWRDQIFIDNIMEGLDELIVEMESRYRLMERNNVQNVSQLDLATRPPYIVVVVDELADLVMSIDGKEIEINLIKLAQKARASGIHLILATQRPDSQTFKGLLRTNIPARIALRVQKSTESKIILDQIGAESLVGKGDRLVKWGGEPKLRHGFDLTD